MSRTMSRTATLVKSTMKEAQKGSSLKRGIEDAAENNSSVASRLRPRLSPQQGVGGTVLSSVPISKVVPKPGAPVEGREEDFFPVSEWTAELLADNQAYHKACTMMGGIEGEEQTVEVLLQWRDTVMQLSKLMRSALGVMQAAMELPFVDAGSLPDGLVEAVERGEMRSRKAVVDRMGGNAKAVVFFHKILLGGHPGQGHSEQELAELEERITRPSQSLLRRAQLKRQKQALELLVRERVIDLTIREGDESEDEALVVECQNQLRGFAAASGLGVVVNRGASKGVVVQPHDVAPKDGANQQLGRKRAERKEEVNVEKDVVSQKRKKPEARVVVKNVGNAKTQGKQKTRTDDKVDDKVDDKEEQDVEGVEEDNEEEEDVQDEEEDDDAGDNKDGDINAGGVNAADFDGNDVDDDILTGDDANAALLQEKDNKRDNKQGNKIDEMPDDEGGLDEEAVFLAQLEEAKLSTCDVLDLMQKRDLDGMIHLQTTLDAPDMELATAAGGSRLVGDVALLQEALSTEIRVSDTEGVGFLLRWWRLAKYALTIRGIFQHLREEQRLQQDQLQQQPKRRGRPPKIKSLEERWDALGKDLRGHDFRHACFYDRFGALLVEFPGFIWQLQFTSLEQWKSLPAMVHTVLESNVEQREFWSSVDRIRKFHAYMRPSGQVPNGTVLRFRIEPALNSFDLLGLTWKQATKHVPALSGLGEHVNLFDNEMSGQLHALVAKSGRKVSIWHRNDNGDGIYHVHGDNSKDNIHALVDVRDAQRNADHNVLQNAQHGQLARLYVVE